MKIFIAYESPAGGTRKMAELLGSLLPAESAALFDLRKEMPNPADFDFAVVGGPVYMGRLTGRLRRFLARSGGQITAMPHALFLCGGYGDLFEDRLARLFPAQMVESAVVTGYFGGELDPEAQKGFLRRQFVRHLRQQILESEDPDEVLPTLLPEQVSAFSDAIRHFWAGKKEN